MLLRTFLPLSALSLELLWQWSSRGYRCDRGCIQRIGSKRKRDCLHNNPFLSLRFLTLFIFSFWYQNDPIALLYSKQLQSRWQFFLWHHYWHTLQPEHAIRNVNQKLNPHAWPSTSPRLFYDHVLRIFLYRHRLLSKPYSTHVINYQLPDEIETYNHRSGRTGRAGK